MRLFRYFGFMKLWRILFLVLIAMGCNFTVVQASDKSESAEKNPIRILIAGLFFENTIKEKDRNVILNIMKNTIANKSSKKYIVLSEKDLSEAALNIAKRQKLGEIDPKDGQILLDSINAEEIIYGKILINQNQMSLHLKNAKVISKNAQDYSLKSSVDITFDIKNLDKEIEAATQKLLKGEKIGEDKNPDPDANLDLDFDEKQLCLKEENKKDCRNRVTKVLTKLYACNRDLLENRNGASFVAHAMEIYGLAQLEPLKIQETLDKCLIYKTEDSIESDAYNLAFLDGAEDAQSKHDSLKINIFAEKDLLFKQALAFVKGVLQPKMECQSRRLFASAGWVVYAGAIFSNIYCYASNGREYGGLGVGLLLGVGMAGADLGYKALPLKNQDLSSVSTDTSNLDVKVAIGVGKVIEGDKNKESNRPNSFNMDKSSGILGISIGMTRDKMIEFPVIPLGTNWDWAILSYYTWFSKWHEKMSLKKQKVPAGTKLALELVNGMF